MDSSLQNTGRFLAPLEKRSHSGNLLAPLAPIDSARNKRFEITNFPTNSPLPSAQIGLSIKSENRLEPLARNLENASSTATFKGFTLSGKGSMFLKSNIKKVENETDTKNPFIGSSNGKNVKSILRDTSLTDVRNRSESKMPDIDLEDRKIVRFNLNESMKNTGEMYDNLVATDDDSSNEDDENADWDFDGENIEGAETHVKEITMTLNRNAQQQNEMRLADESESKDTGPNSLTTIFDRNSESGRIKPLYEDTDSTESVASIKSGSNHRIVDSGKDLRKMDLPKPISHRLKLFEAQDQNKKSNSNDTNRMELIEEQKLIIDKIHEELEYDFEEEKRKLHEIYDQRCETLKIEHESKIKQLENEWQEKVNDEKIELESQHNVDVEKFKQQLMNEFDEKRKTLSQEHRSAEAKLQESHKILLQELERDLKSEEELIRKEHTTNLKQAKDKLLHELDLEKQKMRETGESHMYEKIRCEKRLLEDKYRCLKEKYARLKTDVKISLERRQQRRHEQQSLTTGSETERSNSNKPHIRSASVSSKETDIGKPPAIVSQSQRKTTHDKSVERDRSVHANEKTNKKYGVAAKYLSHVQSHQYLDDTSISQSDTTISNTFHHTSRRPAQTQVVLADNGNSDSEAFQPQENNNNVRDTHGRHRKKTFTRTKSASTSRLNSSNARNSSNDPQARPCTPVESLRRQLQKLEDLEDQFPDNPLDTTYHLRYPFNVESSKEHGASSSELEFFKHRIHLERDSVRRAKESLSTQRINFRARQRELKHRHKTATRHTVDQMIQEEKELTEMEVNLHRTRALLGEKVIRLRHLEQSLQRLYDNEKPHSNQFTNDNNKDDATLSDLSSHSSSGFSSTDFASDTHQGNGQRKEIYQESTEIIQSLEHLNAEIREIWDILSKQHTQGKIFLFSFSF